MVVRHDAAAEERVERRRLEIVHESLLSNWPRLKRWRTQDAEGAQLRDDLRQAANRWEEKGRPDGLLWTGTAFKEYELWQERYSGGLSEREVEFTRAMTAHGLRRRRQLRTAVAGVLFVAVAVAAVTTVLWQRSEQARREAEAAELLSAGRLRLEGNPSAAIAHALASLERADNEPARQFAVEALWRGPMVSVVTESVAINGTYPEWSPDGRWLALGGTAGLVLRNQDGGEVHQLESGLAGSVGFSDDNMRLVTHVLTDPPEFHLWSLPGAERLQWGMDLQSDEWVVDLFDQRLLTIERETSDQPNGPLVLRERSLDGTLQRTLANWSPQLPKLDNYREEGEFAIDPAGIWFASVEDSRLLRRSLEAVDEPPQVLGRHQGKVTVWVRPWSDRIVTASETGEVRLWDADTGRLERTLDSPAAVRKVALAPSGRYIAAAAGGPLPPDSFNVFDLEAPRGAAPVGLLHDEAEWLNGMAFHPDNDLLAAGHYPLGIFLWNLAGRRAVTLREKGPAIAVAFTPDGRLVSTSDAGVVRLWPSWREPEAEVRELESHPGRNLGSWVAVSPDGRFAVVAWRWRARIFVIPLDGSPAVEHQVADRGAIGGRQSLSPDGRRVATTSAVWGEPGAASIRILDLETGEVRILRPEDTAGACVVNSPSLGAMQTPFWLPDGRLVSDGALGLRLWDLTDGSSRQLRACRDSSEEPLLGAPPDSRTLFVLTDAGQLAPGETRPLVAFDLETGASRDLAAHGNRVSTFALDPTGTILVTGDEEGVVRVGPLAGGEPHLSFGHSRQIDSVAVSPDGRWIASASNDDTIRLWPMPDLDQPPLHTLPLDELLAKLESLTNLRVVEDPESATGWKVEPGPTPNWEEVPEW